MKTLEGCEQDSVCGFSLPKNEDEIGLFGIQKLKGLIPLKSRWVPGEREIVILIFPGTETETQRDLWLRKRLAFGRMAVYGDE